MGRALLTAALGTLTTCSVGTVNCDEWNTREFFETVTTVDVTDCLVAGSDLEARNDNGYTPLHFASFNENPTVVEALIAAGADVAARDGTGFTPLHTATSGNENPAVIEALIAA